MLNVKCRKCGKRYDDFEFDCCPRCGADNRAPRRDDLGDAGDAARHLIADEFAERELKRSVQETEEVIAKAERELAEATAEKHSEETHRAEDEEKKRASSSTQGGRFRKILAYECLFGIVLIIIGVAISDSGTPLAGALAGTGFLLVVITALGMVYADSASRRKNRERKNGRQRPKIGLLGGALLGFFFVMFVLWYVVMHVEIFNAFREAMPQTYTRHESSVITAQDGSTFWLLSWWQEDDDWILVKLEANFVGTDHAYFTTVECIDADGSKVFLSRDRIENEYDSDTMFFQLRFALEESLTPQAFVMEEWDRNMKRSVSTQRIELKPELFAGKK